MPTPIKTLPRVGDSWRNTETDESGIVVGYAPDAPYMGDDGKLYPTTSPVVKYNSGETLFGVLPQYYLPEVEISRDFKSQLDWSPESWFGLRVPKPDGTLFDEEEAERLASHVPEYLNIERKAKANGTWLRMPDGSKWEGDPRSWVMMQSEAFKKNYDSQPWYTGQAEWPTKFDYPDDKEGMVRTNKMIRAPYYDDQMWFSNDKSYGDAFAHFYDSNAFENRRYKYWERDVKGKNFLSAIPKDTYRDLDSPLDGTADNWSSMPYKLEGDNIVRLPKDSIDTYNKPGYGSINTRIDDAKVITDSVVNWSKELGDKGILLHNVEDGPGVIIPSMEEFRKNGNYIQTRPILEEFISQPGFTKKVKFIEGNTGDFDITNPYKYAYNDKVSDSNYAAYGGKLNTYKQWQDLSIKEKADMIKVGVKNGLTNMSDIRQKYNEFANGGNLYAPGGWRDIAKYHIRRNEGFRQHSYADAPKGKSWRSVGYGFNDSGFYSKYPMGISKYYDSRGGITRQEAEQELDYMLNIMENQARRAYGSRWDQFNDNQKAAIMDTMYQRPASVLKGSQFYKAVMAGDPNAGNYLGVTGYANRNNIRRGLFGNPQITVPQEQQLQMQQPLIIPYESLNIQAQNTPQAAQQPVDLEALRRQQELDERQQALAERAQAAETRQRGMENLMMAWRMLNEDTSSTDTSNSMPNMLTNNPYLLAEGGNLYVAGGRKRNPVSIQTNSPKVDLSNSNYVYNAIPYLFAQDGLEVVMTSGFRPNSIVVGNGNKSRHSQINGAGDFRPKNGDYARMLQILNDPNSHVSRWMRMNGFGYLNEAPSIGGTTKHWPKKYFLADGRPGPHDHFHIGRDFAQQYASMFKNMPLQQEPQQMQPVFMPVMTDPVLASYQRPVQQPQPLVDEAAQKALLEQQERETALAEKQQAAREKQHNMQIFANVYDLLYNSGNNRSDTPTTYTAPNGNPFRFAAYGGEIKTK